MLIIFPIVYIVFLFSFDFVSSKIKITIKPTRDTQIRIKPIIKAVLAPFLSKTVSTKVHISNAIEARQEIIPELARKIILWF